MSSNIALGQTPAPGAGSPTPAEAAQEGVRRQVERTREQQLQLQAKVDVLQAPEPAVTLSKLPIESPCFIINKVIIANTDVWRFRELRAAAEPVLQHCVGVQGLRQIASVLDAKLIELGYVTTRVSLPQQNLTDGTLSFSLHVGRVAEVVMIKAGQPGKVFDDAWGTWRNAFPLAQGDILNIRDLEQGVEQMKRLSSQQVATKIEPGQEADTSIVLIERPIAGFKDRVRGGLTLDNSGSEALGRGQLSTFIALDNPLGLNDIFNLSGNINAQHPSGDHRTLGVSSSYSIPWKYSTLNLSLSSSRFAQFVQGTTARFLSSGSSSTAEAKWNYIAWRSASAKAGVYAGMSTRRAESFLDDVELVVQRRRTSTFESGVTLKQFIGQGSLDLDLAYRMGVTWGSAQEDYPSAANGGLTIRPRILSFNIALNEPFTLGQRAYQYNASLRGQHTRNTTLSIDQFSIGNRSSVRGFDGDSVLLAESGFALRNEISTALPTFAGVDFNPFVGLDFGAVSGPSAKNLVGTKLAGLAVGTRGRWKELQFDLTLATPLSKPEKFRSRTVNPYVSVTYSR